MSLPRAGRWVVTVVAALLLTFLTVSLVNAHGSTYCGHGSSGIAYRTVFIKHWNQRYTIIRDDGSVWYGTDHKHKYGHGPHLNPPWDHTRVKSCN